ncbi:MAG: sigma-54-dependent Fis family transcriptional regulator [Fibrobacteres bacterium]|nr:sigma-54-dependent Fis family transcriptional regulator [Fibrobacterota bacterium]
MENILQPEIINQENLFYKIDPKGFIEPLFDNPFYHLPIAKTIFAREKNIFSLFSLPEASTVNEALRKFRGPIYLKSTFSAEILHHLGYYTNIPYLLLHTYNMEDGTLLGKVSLGKYLPNINFTNNNIILYADTKDRLRGFNNKLLRGLSKREADTIRNSVGSSLHDFMDPTPLSMQETYFRKIDAVADKEWNTTYISEEKFEIKNMSDAFTFMKIPVSVDTEASDVRLSVSCSIINGDGPILSIAPNELISSNSDNHTYQAGKSFKEESFTIKHNGNFLKVTQGSLPVGKITLTLSIADKFISLSMNNKIAARYYDPDIERNCDNGLQIMTRPGTNIIVDKIEVQIRPVLKMADDDKGGSLVKLNHLPGRVFLLNRFHNIAFTSTFKDVLGFALTDVSEIEQRAILYRNRYRQEKKKREELKTMLTSPTQIGSPFIGSSKETISIREKINLVSASPAPILLEGATGTGKDVIARIIHEESGRDGLFVKIDCSALPSELIESELFGHERGAFTGATERKIGRFEQAQNGTIFIDEISNIPRNVQAKLLNVLQDMTIYRLGGTTPIPLNARLVTASNVPLKSLITQGLFREDLLFRINVITIQLPSLKDRVEDIPELCTHFLKQLNHSLGRSIKGLTAEAYQKLISYSWPGNIRELRNIIQKAMLFTSGDMITEESIQLEEGENIPASLRRTKRENYHLNTMSRNNWMELLKKHNGLVSKVAEELGATRKTCYRNFKKHNIIPEDLRKQGYL